ncbi:uncharacterized protein LOC126265545 isoform X2 [Aethina tumida]|uniref:uncharacterized protein LOC126265545 isoform X2 n=1 Tax=Aethina tumida TaxID=116153 RepID=UPI002147CFDE|nr:uncharacterized protein LOC126265545 isoform X2 [Aethina tumida]
MTKGNVLTPLFAKVVSVKYICVSDKPSEILRWDIKNSGKEPSSKSHYISPRWKLEMPEINVYENRIAKENVNKIITDERWIDLPEVKNISFNKICSFSMKGVGIVNITNNEHTVIETINFVDEIGSVVNEKVTLLTTASKWKHVSIKYNLQNDTILISGPEFIVFISKSGQYITETGYIRSDSIMKLHIRESIVTHTPGIYNFTFGRHDEFKRYHCVSMYVSTCTTCSMRISLINENNIKHITESSSEWTYAKICSDYPLEHDFILQVDLKNHYLDYYWSFDYLHLCNENDQRYIEHETEYFENVTCIEGYKEMKVDPNQTNIYEQHCGKEILKECLNVDVCHICCRGTCYIVDQYSRTDKLVTAIAVLGSLFITLLIINVVKFWCFYRSRPNKHPEIEVNHYTQPSTCHEYEYIMEPNVFYQAH